MDLKEHIVGEVEGYPVIYIEEKDTIFCKNTAVKYSLLKKSGVSIPFSEVVEICFCGDCFLSCPLHDIIKKISNNLSDRFIVSVFIF